MSKKVLTVKNPWAWLIFHGGKDVENRTWRTDYRGCLYIHASKKPRDIIIDDSFVTCEEIDYLTALDASEHTNGFIIGHVDLIDCIRNSASVWAEPNMWHWILKNPVLLPERIPAKGQLRIWNYN